MRKTIVYRIIFFYVVILLISLLTTAFLYSNAAQNFMNKQASYILDRDQEMLTKILKENTNHEIDKVQVEIDESYQRFLKEMFDWRITYITSQFAILNEFKRDIFLSSKDNKSLFYNNILPIAKEHIKRNSTYSFTNIFNKTTYNVRIVSIKSDISTDLVGGWLIIYTPSAPVDDLISDMKNAITLSFIVSIFLLLITGLMFARMLTAPIIKLKTSAELISSRDFDTRVDIKSKDELGMLAEAINKMAESLKDYDEAQKRFLQNSSHELKTPLMSIQGYAEGLKDDIFTDKSEALDIIISESKRLKKLVEDLLLLSKLETLDDFYNIKKVDIGKTINSAVNKIHGAALHEGIDIKINSLVSREIPCDEDKIIHGLLNIIGNAIRYASSNITIDTKAFEDRYKIYIKDDGPGLKANDIDKIFIRFYKGEKGITGLGLSITKIIIEHHNGSIKAYNNEKGGATFEIALPLN